MRAAALLLTIFCGCTAAAADEARAPGCRLTPAECALALHEVAVDAELFAQDQQIVGLGLSPRDRARALIRRDDDRMAARFRQLPAPVAAEVARLRACQAPDGPAGTVVASDPRCR